MFSLETDRNSSGVLAQVSTLYIFLMNIYFCFTVVLSICSCFSKRCSFAKTGGLFSIEEGLFTKAHGEEYNAVDAGVAVFPGAVLTVNNKK